MRNVDIAIAAVTLALFFLVGCSAPKPVKLDGTERVPVNKAGAEKEWKENGANK
jgi:uncharacterized protein YcfL